MDVSSVNQSSGFAMTQRSAFEASSMSGSSEKSQAFDFSSQAPSSAPAAMANESSLIQSKASVDVKRLDERDGSSLPIDFEDRFAAMSLSANHVEERPAAQIVPVSKTLRVSSMPSFVLLEKKPLSEMESLACEIYAMAREKSCFQAIRFFSLSKLQMYGIAEASGGCIYLEPNSGADAIITTLDLPDDWTAGRVRQPYFSAIANLIQLLKTIPESIEFRQKIFEFAKKFSAQPEKVTLVLKFLSFDELWAASQILEEIISCVVQYLDNNRDFLSEPAKAFLSAHNAHLLKEQQQRFIAESEYKKSLDREDMVGCSKIENLFVRNSSREERSYCSFLNVVIKEFSAIQADWGDRYKATFQRLQEIIGKKVNFSQRVIELVSQDPNLVRPPFVAKRVNQPRYSEIARLIEGFRHFNAPTPEEFMRPLTLERYRPFSERHSEEYQKQKVQLLTQKPFTAQDLRWL
jgi:hypothetical protein